jgi:AAA ATPase domain
MNEVYNPFTPGAGRTPPLIAGRETVLNRYDVILQRVKLGKTNNPVLMYGLRGVGKTVLLNRISEMAYDYGFFVENMELDEASEMNFKEAIFNSLKAVLYKLDTIENLKSKFLQVLKILKSISLNYEGVKMSLDIDEAIGEADSRDFQSDLSLLMQQVGRVAKEVNKPICIIIDELQNLSKYDLAALLGAVHRIIQLNFPIVVIGAGLPNLISLSVEAKSYTERFDFIEIGPLTSEAAFEALSVPFVSQGVSILPEACELIVSQTEGYPFFIQMYGEIIWNAADAPLVDLPLVRSCIPVAIQKLDASFFESRFHRTTDEERKFLLCMASTMIDSECDTLTIGACLGKSAQHVGQYRNRLLEKGFIYSPAVGKLVFTVPLFQSFILRRMA